MYRNGWGVSQDYKEAVRWYRLAAEQGHAMAQSNLGVMYRNGEGVLADFIIAHMWFSIAANNGNELAAENREKLEKRITSEDISKAQAMARICMCRILIALLMTLAKHTAAETFEGKEAVMKAIQQLEPLFLRRPNAFLLQIFFDAKVDEIVNLFKEGPKVDFKATETVLKKIAPFFGSRWKQIKA